MLPRATEDQVGGLGTVDKNPALARAGAVQRDTGELRFGVGAGHLRHERHEIAALGHLLDLVAAEARCTRALCNRDERRRHRHAHCFSGARRRQDEIDGELTADPDVDPGHDGRNESGKMAAQLVRAGRQIGETVRADRVGPHLGNEPGQTTRNDRNAGQDSPARVFDDAFDRSPLLLRRRGCEAQDQKEADGNRSPNLRRHRDLLRRRTRPPREGIRFQVISIGRPVSRDGAQVGLEP